VIRSLLQSTVLKKEELKDGISNVLCATYIIFYCYVIFRAARMWVGGFDINLIWLILLCFVLFMVVFNGLIDLCEDALPVAVVEAFRHGGEIDQSASICPWP
jgi:hypothetical protein